MLTLRTFRNDQRVHVVRDADGRELGETGTVRRVRTDGGAWIELDRVADDGTVVAREDERPRRRVMAYPADCTPQTKSDYDARMAEPDLTPANFGRDHWSTFAYLEHAIVDRRGAPERCRMRCDAQRHPMLADAGMELAFRGIPCPPTRLKGGALVQDHDDWDCAEDLERAGLIENLGTGANPIFQMTGAGWAVASTLRQWKATGGTFDAFNPAIEARPAAEVSP